MFASEKSIGKECFYKRQTYFVEGLNIDSFCNLDFVFFCAGTDVSKKWVLVAEAAGCFVIDNSSHFRMDKDVCLIVPEVNFDKYDYKRKLIANPNCSTIQSVICLNALKKFGIKRVIYNTYQAVSGSGIKGINDLIKPNHSFYKYDIKQTCIPQIDVFLDNGFTKEEMKMIDESRKILDSNELNISATCIRVPVLFSHGVSVLVELDEEFEMSDIYKAFSEQKGLIIVDDIYQNLYPTSVIATGNDNVYVGRIRKDLFYNKSILFYCVADNMRKGAASNAVEIALKIIENSL